MAIYSNGQVGWYSGVVAPSISYLLDTYSGAAAAYSLRRLSSTYTGNAITVRRSSDNTSTNIGFDANGNLDTTALTTFVGSNNQALYSEEFDNVNWNKYITTVTSNQTTAPDGTMTADLLAEASANNYHTLSNGINLPFSVGTSWNVSLYIKKGPGTSAPNTIILGFPSPTTNTFPYPCVLFNISSGTVLDSSNTSNDANFGSSIVDAGNGWWRCSVWGTVTSAGNRFQHGVIRFNNNLNTINGAAYAGNAQSNIYIWGWQFQKALNDTSVLTTQPYTKTTATANAGNGFVSTWFDQSGNGYNLIQNTAANQARIVLNGVLETLNGKPALVSKFNSANNAHYNATYNSTVTSPSTVFHIGSNVGSAAATYLFDSISVNPRTYSTSYNTTWLRIGGTLGGPSEFALTGYTQGITTQRIINAIYNGSSSKLSINNGSYTTGDTKASGASGLTLGASYGNTLHATAYYQEHIVYPSNQESNVNNIDTNINSYYTIY